MSGEAGSGMTHLPHRSSGRLVGRRPSAVSWIGMPLASSATAWPDSLCTLLDDLSGMALNRLRLPGHGESLLSVVTRPTPVRKRAFQSFPE